MNIAVVDVAANEGGALSVLKDFCDTLCNLTDEDNEWYIITSVVDIEENRFIHNIKYPEIKKSWKKRMQWEKQVLPKLLADLKIDIVFSLQNNAFQKGSYKQIVYLHNVLMLQKFGMFIDFKPYNRNLAIRTNILAPYIRNTWKNADKMIVQGKSVKEQLSRYYHKKDIEVVRPNVQCAAEVRNVARQIKGYIYPTSGFSYKNIEAIIEAERTLNSKGVMVEVLVTIDGTENGYTKAIVESAKDVGGIKFIGIQSRERLFQLYKDYGLLMTSKLESFGVPIIEAMMVGTVVVGIARPYFLELTKGYERCYCADQESDLAKLMQEGLLNSLIGNYAYQEEGWIKVIDIIKNL